MIALRRVSLGRVSLVPNQLPLLMAFGIWISFIGEVSFAATVTAALTFGLVVDDTVHILVKYRALRTRGQEPNRAFVSSFRSVGIAVFLTPVDIGTGFAAFALSGFFVNQHFGLLSALTLGAALLVNLLFLPPLLLWVDKLTRSNLEQPDRQRV